MRLTRMKTGMIVTVFLATAFIIGGCSTDNRITAPGAESSPDITKGQQLATPITGSDSNFGRIAVDSDDADSDEFSITAKVNRLDIEGGCYFLATTEGENYTPVTPVELKLKKGMVLAAKGYIDRDIYLFCGNGPAFVIKKYEIIDDGQTHPYEDRASKAVITEHGFNEDLPEYKRDAERYQDRSDMDRAEELKKKLEEQKTKNESAEDRYVERTDDNDNDDRFQENTEDRFMNDSRNIEEENKKKIEQERRPGDAGDPEDENPGTVVDPQIPEEIQPS